MATLLAESGWVSLARTLSWIFGWVYFLSWSGSFYAQPWLNIKRKTTAGLTVDFPLLNVLGFMCYTTSTAAFLFNDEVRAQYAVRHPSAPRPTVRPNDFAFALHALVICIITFTQFWSSLWGFREIRGKRASRAAVGIFYGSLLGILLVAVIVIIRNDDPLNPEAWAGIDVVRAS